MNLEEWRKQIDAIDEQLISLLNERTALALQIGKRKQEEGAEVYVPAREKAVLDRVAQLNQGPLPDDAIRAIYREIMSASISLEQPVRVAYLGPPATFTHQAARLRFGASVEYLPCQTIAEVFGAVQRGTCAYGVAPIENSTEGSVNSTLDELMVSPIRIYAEMYAPISHHLMSLHNEIEKVYSHPQVFGQCRVWLATHLPRAEQVPVSSTSRAAQLAKQEPASAAVGSELAAELHGLPIVHRHIEDKAGNATRFIVLAKRYGGPTGTDKTSIAFSVQDRVGALHEALAAFERHRLNLARIESRPSKSKAWEYMFMVDLEGHAEDEPVRNALRDLAEHCTTLTILGSYPREAALLGAE